MVEEVVDFHHSFRYVSQQTFAVALKRLGKLQHFELHGMYPLLAVGNVLANFADFLALVVQLLVEHGQLFAHALGLFLEGGDAFGQRFDFALAFEQAVLALVRRKEGDAGAGQQIAAGGTGLTKAKLIQAKKLFRQNEADAENGEELYIGYTGEQLEDLLSQTEPASSDYNNVKALVDGTIKRWMGFEWVPSERFTKASTTRSIHASGAV